MKNLLILNFKIVDIILKICYYSYITNRKGIFMKNRLTKNLLTDAILFIFFIFVFIQACGPTPAVEITDATQTPITTRGKIYTSTDPILGADSALTISDFSEISVTVSIMGTTGTSTGVTLTNISGYLGNYTYGNNEMTLSVMVADDSSINVNLTRLKAPYLLLENITCSTQP